MPVHSARLDPQPISATWASPARTPPMSLSRSPSPQQGGGWSTPGLTDDSGHETPRQTDCDELNVFGSNGIALASAKAKNSQVRNTPSFITRNEGFFSRQRRKISATLPRFNGFSPIHQDWSAGKVGGDPWDQAGGGQWSRLKTLAGNVLRKFKVLIFILVLIALTTVLWSRSNITTRYRKAARFGGGSKFVMILAANEGGGVMEWKGSREWAIERDSVKNKKIYAAKWGYELEIVDMSTKKRYAHEWRESWEKVDTIRNCLRKYPDAEWFWWLDLNTFIMEPSYSLQAHIFDNLADNTYRDINIYNPLHVTHPPVGDFLDPITLSPVGDNKSESINLIVPQDCSGFTLGTFFMRRSQWTDRLLDIWWDPVCYEQKHMEWEHKEQDALEYLYSNQPWIRPHTAFIQQRKVNSYPPGACGGDDGILDPRFHYHEEDRDFMVNTAGCEWGRDCWGEIYNYRELSNKLNRNRWQRFKDAISDWWKSFQNFGSQKVDAPKEEADKRD